MPSSAATMADGSPLRSADNDDLDVDGDQFGAVYVDTAQLAESRVTGLVQGGHGFNIETTESDTPIATVCPFCDGPMYELPEVDEWFCEFNDAPVVGLAPDCRCNWCLCRELWAIDELRGVGQPRVYCQGVECKRKYDANRQRLYRARKPLALPRAA